MNSKGAAGWEVVAVVAGARQVRVKVGVLAGVPAVDRMATGLHVARW